MFCRSLAGCVYHARTPGKNLLDWVFPMLYTFTMSKHIIKIDKSSASFRLILPKQIIEDKGWLNVSHVLVEDHWGDRLIIRRLMNDESNKTQDK